MLHHSKRPALLRPADPFDPYVIEQIKAHAVDVYPREACGFVLPDGFMPCENISPDPENTFIIDPQQTAVALQRGALAMVHSHPDGPNWPSEADQQCQIDSGMTCGVLPLVGVDRGDEVIGMPGDVLWWGDDLPVAPLRRRPFIWGIWHCYAILRDWWWTERGVRIPNFATDKDFVDNSQNVFEDRCERAGFRNLGKIAIADLQTGDCLVGHLRGEHPNHCGVYLGGDTFLHHPPRGISGEALLLRWWPHIDTVMRYDG